MLLVEEENMTQRLSPELARLAEWLIIASALVAAIIGLTLYLPTVAVAQSSPPAIDLMLIIDNSCSMYKPGTPSCGLGDALGTDPDFLRIKGAELFAARLAFGEVQPQDRIGAISLGTSPFVVYPLKPVTESRGPLAATVYNPAPLGGTSVMGALRLAYDEFRRNPSNNKPVIVFLTDGVPYPSAGQSFSDIEALVKAHSNVPIYVLLLQNGPAVPPDYKAYIDEWKKFQPRMNNVQVYVIPDYKELLATYDKVMADVTARPQGPPPRELRPGMSEEFYVSRFARRVYVTVIHPDKERRGGVEIKDKSGQPILAGEPGVDVFIDKDNSTEVYLASGPRLAGQTGGNWRVTSIDATFSYVVDLSGAYKFKWLTPPASEGVLPGVLIVNDRVNPLTRLDCQFLLVDEQGAPILDRQNISGQVILPDGTKKDLQAGHFSQDATGLYHLQMQLADYGAQDSRGRFVIDLKSDDPDQTGPASSIAKLTVWIESDPNVPTPVPPTNTPTPTLTPTITPTPTPYPPRTVPPPSPTPCPNPPLCKSTPEIVLWIILGLAGLAAVVYILLRIVLKPPEGHVLVVEDGQPRSHSISLKANARGKLWGWWEMTVGPQGDIRIHPKLSEAGSVGVGVPGPASESDVTVYIPGVGETVVPSGTGRPTGGKRKGKAPTKRGKILGRFVNEEGKTRFINEYARGSIVLTGDSLQTVSFGNIQLRMCLDREKVA